MDIFESLENLGVSEACFDEIMGIVEEIINERDFCTRPTAAKNSIEGRRKASYDAVGNYATAVEKDRKDKDIPKMDVSTTEYKDGKVQHVYGYDEDDNMHRDYVEASPEVQNAYKKMKRADSRLSHADIVARQSVGDALRHEDDHQKKVHGK